jgi:hypothetical protein
MADIQKLTGTGNNTPTDLTTGTKAVPSRAFLVPPPAQPALLVNGSQHLALPGFTPTEGASIFYINGDVGGANLTGMGGGSEVIADITEYALLGILVALINVASSMVTTSADDAGSPVGTRFTTAINLNPGQAQLFICAEAGGPGGEKKWFPVTFNPFG